MSLVSPIAGVASTATVSTKLEGGADLETDDSLRTRLLDRLRTPPRGGTREDYSFWAKGASSAVTRAWARANSPGLGQVRVYFMTDDATANGIPETASVTTVQDYINARRPVTADVTVSAPTAVALDFQIEDLTPTSAEVRAAVEAELADLIRRETEPGGTLLVSHIREAISTAMGETDHTLRSPTNDVTVGAAEITTLGTVTFTTS